MFLSHFCSELVQEELSHHHIFDRIMTVCGLAFNAEMCLCKL